MTPHAIGSGSCPPELAEHLLVVQTEGTSFGDGFSVLGGDGKAVLDGPEGFQDDGTQGFDAGIDSALQDPPSSGAGPNACPGEQAKISNEDSEVAFGHEWSPAANRGEGA